MDTKEIISIVGALGGIFTIIGVICAFLRNFKKDIMDELFKLRSEMKEFKQETRENFKKVDEQLDDIRTDIREIRTGLNRLEGAFYGKECCMLSEGNTQIAKEEKKTKKVKI